MNLITKRLPTILIASAALLFVGVMSDTAEARRGFRYRAAPAARYWNPYASRRYGRAYRAPRRSYYSGYRGYSPYGYGGYGYGRGVSIGAPGVGVRIGF